jgi:hypothetical protein
MKRALQTTKPKDRKPEGAGAPAPAKEEKPKKK